MVSERSFVHLIPPLGVYSKINPDKNKNVQLSYNKNKRVVEKIMKELKATPPDIRRVAGRKR